MLLEKYIQATYFSTSNNAFLICMPSFSGKHRQMITPIIDFVSLDPDWLLEPVLEADNAGHQVGAACTTT